MSSSTYTAKVGAIYMRIKDRHKLASLMIVNEVSQRQLAAAAGWGPNSHSFMARLVKGQASSVSAESAVRIAHHLSVPVDSLFETRMDSFTNQTKPKSKSTSKATQS